MNTPRPSATSISRMIIHNPLLNMDPTGMTNAMRPIIPRLTRAAGAAALSLVIGCASPPLASSRAAASPSRAMAPSPQGAAPSDAGAAAPPKPAGRSSRLAALEPPSITPLNPANLVAASYADLPNWTRDDHRAALAAFRAGCPVLEKSEIWRAVCARARDSERARAPRAFFEGSFRVFRIVNTDGSDTGMITGYYEPLLHGSRTRSGPYVYPVYSPPDDLISIHVGALFPETRD